MWGRWGLSTEILGALLSVFSIWVVTGILVYLAAQRLLSADYDIEGGVMLITSACAVAVNIVYVPPVPPLPGRPPSSCAVALGTSPPSCPQDGAGSAPDGARAQPRRSWRGTQHQRPRRLHPRRGGPAAEHRCPHRVLHHLL